MKRILSVLAAALLVISCGCSDAGARVNFGDEVKLSEKCIGAVNEESYSKMSDYCSRRDETGLEIMQAAGLIDILYSGTTGTVTDMGFGKTKIRLASGREFWVASEFVEAKK